MFAASDGKYTLLVLEDNDPLNPRDDYNPLGRMVCWHRRYWLGDKHSYDSPAEFMRDLYRGSVDNCKHIARYLKDGKAENASLSYNRHTHEWELCERLNPQYDWHVIATMSKEQFNLKDSIIDDMLDALEPCDLHSLIAELDNLVILPLYLYNHSILSMSTDSFIGRAVHAEWDSGQVGFIYADRKMLEKVYGECTHKTIETAEAILKGEVDSYDKYLRGECYGFRLYEEGEEIDSCWGFLGDIDDIRESIRESLPDSCTALVDKLKYSCESEDAYLYKHTAA